MESSQQETKAHQNEYCCSRIAQTHDERARFRWRFVAARLLPGSRVGLLKPPPCGRFLFPLPPARHETGTDPLGTEFLESRVQSSCGLGAIQLSRTIEGQGSNVARICPKPPEKPRQGYRDTGAARIGSPSSPADYDLPPCASEASARLTAESDSPNCRAMVGWLHASFEGGTNRIDPPLCRECYTWQTQTYPCPGAFIFSKASRSDRPRCYLAGTQDRKRESPLPHR